MDRLRSLLKRLYRLVSVKAFYAELQAEIDRKGIVAPGFKWVRKY
jgi:hypothetical protein